MNTVESFHEDSHYEAKSDIRKFGITELHEGQSLEAWEKAYLDRAGGNKSSH
jgi:hypothetical protein